MDKRVIMETLVPEMLSKSDSAELQLHGLTIFTLTGTAWFVCVCVFMHVQVFVHVCVCVCFV